MRGVYCAGRRCAGHSWGEGEGLPLPGQVASIQKSQDGAQQRVWQATYGGGACLRGNCWHLSSLLSSPRVCFSQLHSQRTPCQRLVEILYSSQTTLDANPDDRAKAIGVQVMQVEPVARLCAALHKRSSTPSSKVFLKAFRCCNLRNQCNEKLSIVLAEC